MNKVIFTLSRIAFAPARKPYQIGLRFKHKNGDFNAISAKGRGYAVPISKVEGHISFSTIGVHTAVPTTVQPRFTDTRSVRTPHYYGQFALSLGKESLYIFNCLNTDTFYSLVSVRINGAV